MKIPSFLLDEWLNHYHFAPKPPEFDLASSTGPHWTAGQILALMTPEERAHFDETPLVYSAACGSEKLRQTIGTMYGVAPEHVQIVTGVSEALLVLLVLAAGPKANVVLPFPIYPPIAVDAAVLGVETRFYHLRRENNFSADLDEIKGLTDANTKLLLINSPHNPTGATVSNAQLSDLHSFAAERGIPFAADEVYHPLYHGVETTSAAQLPQAIALGSLSKAFSLSGLRVGWIIDRDPARLRQYADARGYFTISNSPLSEALSLVALRHRDTILARTHAVTAANLALLDEFFSESKSELDWVRPRGGTICFPWLKSGGNSREFCRAMAERGVLLAPGDCFDMPEHFRLGFGVTEQGFAHGLERIADYLKSSRPRVSPANFRQALTAL